MVRNASELVTQLDEAPLNRNHIKVISAAILGDMLEFFDFNIIAFVLAMIVVPWNLSYGASSLILLSAGVGSVLGAMTFGSIADKIGRRPIFISTVLFFSAATGIMALTPEGNWVFICVFRFLAGFGVGGLYSVDLPLVQEFVPAKYRGRVGGLVTSFIPLGTMLASIVAAWLSPVIGWRGLFLIGLIPAALTLLIRAWVPESPRWLIRNKRFAEAEVAVDWVTKGGAHFRHSKNNISHDEWIDDLPVVEKPKFSTIFKYKRSVLTTWIPNVMQQSGYYCFTMWGATLLALILGRTPAEAAKLFISVTIAGLLGRFFWSFMSDHLGRRRAGMLLGCCAAVMFVIAINSLHATVGSVSGFWLAMLGIAFFADGGFAITGPYGAEAWPINLRATGMGSAYGIGGIGKILGPMLIAVFAGSSNVVSPQATEGAVIPAYIFIAGCFLVTAITYYFARETKNKTVEMIDDELEREARGEKVPFK